MSEKLQNFIFGPFTKENFNQGKWKQIKEKIYQLNSTNEEETIPDCKDLLQLVLEFNNTDNLDKYFGEPSIKNFFYNDFLCQNAKNLIATKTFNNPEILELSNCCLEEMFFFWLKTVHEENLKLNEMAKAIMDPNRQYYKLNNQEEVSSLIVSGFLEKAPQEKIDWIKSLKEGVLVDCIKVDQQFKKMNWSHARIVHVLDTHVKVVFLNDRDNFSRFLEKTHNAHEIAPYQTKCKDFEWRQSIKKGDIIDACDTSHVWYNSTVLDERVTELDNNNSLKEILIGYRIYDPNGEKTDLEGKKFNGWSARYDEWLSVQSPRINKKNSMAKKLYTGSSSNPEDAQIDDTNDLVVTLEGKKMYAITRSMWCKSEFLVNLVNKLGRTGGFDRMLKFISNTEPWAPIESVSSIVSVIGNMQSLLYRDFAFEFIPLLKDVVFNNIVKSPDSNIRNFTKERLDNIVKALEELLKRVYSIPEVREFIEVFNLEVCGICFASDFLERKLQGLKTLIEIIKTLRMGNLKYLKAEHAVKFINSHQIFDKIFGSKGHVQLVQRSEDFLKFLINESKLDANDLEAVWSPTTKGDQETKLSTYKILNSLSLEFKTEHLEFFIKKISNIHPGDLIAEELELVFSLSKYSLKTSAFSKSVRDFFWEIIINVNDYHPDIVELALNKFCEILKSSWELKEEKMEIFYNCISNIKNHSSVLSSLRILKKLIENYPTSSLAINDKNSKSGVIEHLCKEKSLLDELIANLKNFKASLKGKLGSDREPTEASLDAMCPERASYYTHVSERLGFLNFVLSNSESEEIRLTYELLSDIWETIVNEALIPKERDAVFSWIKETAESKQGFPMQLNDLLKFFQNKMNNQKDYHSMTIEGFNCFKNVFLVINEKLTKINKVNVSGVSQSSNYNYQSSDDNKKETSNEFEYRVCVMPNELEGISSIWNFVLISENEAMTEKAIDFLNKLYMFVATPLESKIIEIRSDFLCTCFKHLQQILRSSKGSESPAFVYSTLRCMSLIRSVMDETEKRGIGNLKSHSGLVKGEILTFNVNNEITMGTDVPKKTELRLHSNSTVYEIRVEIAKQFKCTWDQVRLVRNSSQKEIRDNENGKTLGDIRIRNGETLSAYKRSTPPIPQVPLVLADNSVNPNAKKIFVEWFTTFSENGKMSPEHCANFIHSCTGDFCKGDDKRVKEVFQTWDHDRDGVLTLDNFMEFYTSSCRQRPHVVWNNLHAHHYRNDLKKASEVEEEKVEITMLARYIISENEEYFSLIFSLLDCGGKIAIEAWKLLNSLPTGPKIFGDIVSLKGIRDSSDKNWDLILDSKSTYKMLYALHVIEYLMEDQSENEEEEDGSMHLWKSQPGLLEYKKSWRADFIIYGGFDHLFKIFDTYSKKEHKSLSVFDKNILSFVLKILKNYLTAAFSSKVPHLYRSLSFIRLFHLSLDFISDYIKTEGSQQQAIEGEQNLEIKKADSKTEKEKDDKKKEKLKIEETEEFKVLVERLKGDLGNHIIKTINFKDFIKLLSGLGYDILRIEGDLESEDRMLLEYSVSILTAILLFDKSTIKFFLNPSHNPEGIQNSDKYILDGVFCPKAVNVRRYFSHALYILCKDTIDFENAMPSKYLIGLFLNNLPSSQNEATKDCIQYFELLCKLIEDTYSQRTATDKDLDFENLINKNIEQIKNHVSTERRNNLHLNDKIFIGLIQLCEKLLNVKPELREVVGRKYNLVEEVFKTCLFDIIERENSFQDLIDDQDPNVFGKDYVKAKSKESRAAAYKLLSTLCKDSPANTSIMLENLNQLMKVIMKLNTNTGWGYSPASDTKSFYGYVGLRNLGCICYMNAMLQQFFMTPTFRYAILMADDKKEQNLVKKDQKSNYILDDNVVHQLQQMFGFLELSDRQDYNPHEFCFSFKDYTGQPVNVSIQQDTQEFLNMIFDKLEFGLKHTPFKHIMDSVYGGKTSNQVICNGCGNLGERIETFYNMSVEVKNMKSIYDSFDKHIAGETIDDYKCEACKKKNSITKRTCIEYLPNVLIVHLQRIVFDLDTLMNQKINSRLEFPFDLNMEPYTKEGLEWREKNKQRDRKKRAQQQQAKAGEGNEEEQRVGENEAPKEGESEEELGPYKYHPKEYYEYRLAGVVVHVGTAEFGHYYSYINTCRGDPSKRDKTKADKWLEFNDSTIKDFDPKNIESECFGGNSTDSSDDAWAWVKSGKENSKNAYILVYERVIKDPLKLVIHNPEDSAYLNRVLKIEDVKSKNPNSVKIVEEQGQDNTTITNLFLEYYDLKKYVPARVYKKVWDDNHKFMFERHIYNEEFFKFIKDLCGTFKLTPSPQGWTSPIHPDYLSFPQENKKIAMALINVLEVLIYNLLAKAHDNNSIGELSICMKNLISWVPEAAISFVENTVMKDAKHLIELLLNCPDKQVRYFTSQIALYCINTCVAYYKIDFDLTALTEKTVKSLEAKIDQLPEEERAKVKIEEGIVTFLRLLLGIMPSEVAKNWIKMQQYFEFWRDFAYSGEPHMFFCFQHQMIAILIDFFLEKKSPLPEFTEKKHSMGNRYADPEFAPLMQMIALLVRKGRFNTPSGTQPYASVAHQNLSLFEFSENDMKCLTCPDFYEKAMKDKFDMQAVGLIMQSVCFENDFLSNSLAIILLKAINRSNYDDVKPFLEAMGYFVTITDQFQMKRIEWMLGFPQPSVQSIRNSNESFGMYGNSAIDDLTVNFESPLYIDGSTSVINLMLANRRRLENLCLVCLKQVLSLASFCIPVFEYLISLPPPSYNYAKFTDWIYPFIEYYLAEAKRYYYSSYPKEEAGQEALKIWKIVEEKVNSRMDFTEKAKATLQKEKESPTEQSTQASDSSVGGEKPEVLKSFFSPYIIGQTVSEVEVARKVYGLENDSNEISVVTTEVTCYITESKPTGAGNLAFPEKLLNESKFKGEEVEENSPIAQFIQHKPSQHMGAGQGNVQSGDKLMTTWSGDMEAMLKKRMMVLGITGEGTDDLCPLLDDFPQSLPVLSGNMASHDSSRPGDDGTDTEISMGTSDDDNTKATATGDGDATHPVADHNQQPQGTQPAQQQEEKSSAVTEIEKSEPALVHVPFKSEQNPVIRRVIVLNSTPYTIQVVIGLIPKGQFLNFRLPHSKFKMIVKPNSNFCMLALMKLLPEAGWGEFDIDCTMQKMELISGKNDDSGKKKNATFKIRNIEVSTRGDGVEEAQTNNQ